MQEKCSFLLAHVEITAILAVFLDASGSNGTGRYSFQLEAIRSKRGRAIDENGRARIGRKNLGSGDFAAATGGRISRCRAVVTGKVQVQEILEETLPLCMERLKQNSVELRVSPVKAITAH